MLLCSGYVAWGQGTSCTLWLKSAVVVLVFLRTVPMLHILSKLQGAQGLHETGTWA